MSNQRLHWIDPLSPPDAFPPVDTAMNDPDGLLAVGGDLSPARLLEAYARGIFPWYSDGQPILWWSPDPRCVFRLPALHANRRMRRLMRNSRWAYSFNHAFLDVVDACAAPRPGQDGTWITAEMRDAYGALHEAGWCHSVEVWDDDELAGGIYGVSIGQMFFGESMFSARSNGSKIALIALASLLAERGFPLIDGQVESAHLLSLGAERIPRDEFCEIVTTMTRGRERLGTLPDGRRPIRELAG